MVRALERSGGGVDAALREGDKAVGARVPEDPAAAEGIID